MPQAVWTNPQGGHRAPHKGFCIQFASTYGAPSTFLDRIAGALLEIDNGQFWRFSQPVPRMDVGPGAIQLTASGEYKSMNAPAGSLVMEAVAQPHSAAPYVGLVIRFYDKPKSMLPPWSEQASEHIVAVTLLYLTDSILNAIGFPRQPNQSPLAAWAWYEPTCGWMRGLSVNYGGWSVQLG
jgi:hypothetical protein